MGVTVRQKTKGKPWWVFIAHDGKRASKKIGDKRAAEAVASEIRTELKLGQFSLGEKRKAPLFRHCATGWIETTVPCSEVSPIRVRLKHLKIINPGEWICQNS